MIGTLVSRLRAPDRTVLVGTSAGDAGQLALRVQMPEVWDVIRIEAASDTAVYEIKLAALKELYPGFLSASDFMLRLNGFEVLDEAEKVAATGAGDGSTFLLTFRRRRAVR
jgi:hypothetical protein